MAEWRSVIHTCTLKYEYEVSNDGDVVRVKDGVIQKKYPTKSGYDTVWLRAYDGRCVIIPVHILVANAFLPNPENKPFVDHINTIRNDNRACNLRWVTPLENSNNETTKINRRKRYEDKQART